MNPPNMPKQKVAIFNTDPDIMGVVDSILQNEGYDTATKLITDFEGQEEDIKEFIKNEVPDIIFYHIGPPYKYHWKYCQAMHTKETQGKRFVLLIDDVLLVTKALGSIKPWETVVKPFEYDEIVHAARGEIRKGRESEGPKIHGERSY